VWVCVCGVCERECVYVVVCLIEAVGERVCMCVVCECVCAVYDRESACVLLCVGVCS